MTQEKKQPENLAFETRIGKIRLSIWANTDKNGNTFHNVTIARRFESAPGEWSNSNSYTGLGDIAQLRQAVDIGEEWLRRYDFVSQDLQKAA